MAEPKDSAADTGDRLFPGWELAFDTIVCALSHHVASTTHWGNKKHMNMKHLEEVDTVSLVG